MRVSQSVSVLTAFPTDVDLGAIARTSSAVSSHGPEPVVSVTSDADVSA